MLKAAITELGDEQLGAVVVMLTTSANPRDELRAKSFDVVKGYLEKPLSPEHFGLLSDIAHRS